MIFALFNQLILKNRNCVTITLSFNVINFYEISEKK